MLVNFSAQAQKLAPVSYASLVRAKANAKRKFGNKVIHLTIGAPDRPSPRPIRKKLAKSVMDYRKWLYPLPASGSARLLRRAYDYLWRNDRVTVDPDTEIVATSGSRIGLISLMLALKGPALLPNWGYGAYRTGCILGKVPYTFYECDFGVDQFEAIKTSYEKAKRKPKFVVVCSPGNPIGNVNDAEFFRGLIAWAKENNVVVISDEAYRRTVFDGIKAPGLLEFPGGKEVGVAVFTLSKTVHMAGGRVAFVAGNSDVCDALKRVYTPLSYGIFDAMQDAAVVALGAEYDDYPVRTAAEYQKRRDLICDIFDVYGLEYWKPQGGMFVLLKIPKKLQKLGSIEVVARMLEAVGVEVTPGEFFGPKGRKFLRVALVQPEKVIRPACHKIGSFLQAEAA